MDILDKSGAFEVSNLSGDDLKRSEFYRLNELRNNQQSQFETYEQYLESLNMVAEISPFSELYMNRISQLVGKTNQFNLTTRRYQTSDLEQFARSEGHLTLYGRLIDRFGDNGLVTLILGEVIHDVLVIDLWLMSCRVLKRGLELAMLDETIRRAGMRGVRYIQGIYIPTAKNSMVKDFYEEMGFTKMVEKSSEAKTTWCLNVDNYTAQNKWIKIEAQS